VAVPLEVESRTIEEALPLLDAGLDLGAAVLSPREATTQALLVQFEHLVPRVQQVEELITSHHRACTLRMDQIEKSFREQLMWRDIQLRLRDDLYSAGERWRTEFEMQFDELRNHVFFQHGGHDGRTEGEDAKALAAARTADDVNVVAGKVEVHHARIAMLGLAVAELGTQVSTLKSSMGASIETLPSPYGSCAAVDTAIYPGKATLSEAATNGTGEHLPTDTDTSDLDGEETLDMRLAAQVLVTAAPTVMLATPGSPIAIGLRPTLLSSSRQVSLAQTAMLAPPGGFTSSPQNSGVLSPEPPGKMQPRNTKCSGGGSAVLKFGRVASPSPVPAKVFRQTSVGSRPSLGASGCHSARQALGNRDCQNTPRQSLGRSPVVAVEAPLSAWRSLERPAASTVVIRQASAPNKWKACDDYVDGFRTSSHDANGNRAAVFEI